MSEGQKELRRCRSLFFFFQAEDGIRDKLVTGVQTCALPISPGASRASCGADTLRAPRLDSYTGTSDGRDATASAPQGLAVAGRSPGGLVRIGLLLHRLVRLGAHPDAGMRNRDHEAVAHPQRTRLVGGERLPPLGRQLSRRDRKSTRLNSSH